MSMFGGEERPRRKGRKGGGDGDGAPPPQDIPTPLAEEARRRYLNYALSVITSRALPDVRDGLKPVQRRIIYGMFHDHRLTHDAKYQKCAKVVGTIMGQYHPHGDVAIYDALVRMAQDFSLRYPLVDGHGNFGSLDGDSAAAMRYTECRLAGLTAELVGELAKRTIDYRPNYDGTQFEPIVIPARLPQLLMNGTTGIAVGMATNIPPHNLTELCDALIDLSKHKDLEVKDLLKHIKGPDFPTGGQILNSRAELRTIYETGQGSVRVRGEWKTEELPRGGKQIVITSIPYTVNKSTLVTKIADVINDRKLTPLVNVHRRDHQGRPHRAGDQARERSRAGDGVPLQAHAAADQLRRQPDLPGSHGQRRGRRAEAARSQVDPPLLPRLPLRGGDAAVRVRPQGSCRSGCTSSKASRRSTTRSTR